MRSLVSSLLLVSILTQAGCYSWVPVAPADAQKLSGSFEAPVGGNAVAVRVVQVQRPDGSLAELTGDFDVRLSLKGGASYDFKHPVAVEAEGEELVFRGGNRAPVRTRREDIASVEASKYEYGTTLAVVLIATLVSSAAAFFIAYSLK